MRLLVVEDSPRDAEIVVREIQRGGFDVTWKRVETEADMKAALDAEPWDLVISDFSMPHFDGVATLRVLQEKGLDIPFIIVSGAIGEETAVDMMKKGAHDYLMKDHLARLIPALERALADAAARRTQTLNDEALCTSELRYRRLFESAKDGILILDAETGMVVDVNPFLTELMGYSRDAILEKKVWELGFFKDIAANEKNFAELQAKEYIRYEDKPLETADGRRIDVEFVSNVYRAGPHRVIQCNIRDITERKQMEDRARITKDVLAELNRPNDTNSIVRDILQMIRKYSGAEAVGLRLKDGDDFPYYSTHGFPDSFVRMETHLCAHDTEGQLVRDAQDQPILECMCGNILRGQVDPKRPFFTAAGSFWTNSTTDLLASSTEADRQGRTRNRCNGEGYESVALIPLRAGDEIIGLLQLNDHRRDQFTSKGITFLEGLGASVGIALSRMRSREAITALSVRQDTILSEIPEMIMEVDCNKVYVWANQAGREFFGEEAVGREASSFFVGEQDVYARVQGLFDGDERIVSVESLQRRKDGAERLLDWRCRVLKDADGRIAGALSMASDITERRLANDYREMGQEILQILNEPEDTQNAISRVVSVLKATTGVDAVGIRLQDGDDYPYFVQEGFSGDFLATENTLAARTVDGFVCRNKDGSICLECTCGLVISGKAVLSNPLFTKGGSFWTNDSLPLLDLPPDQDPRLHPRNQCIHQGYASVALVPIRSKEGIVGLLQLNDRRKGRFSLETVERLEEVASHIGSALMRKQAEVLLWESREFLRTVLNSIPVRVFWKDRNLVYVGCNMAFARDAGFDKPGDLVGKDDYAMGWPEQAELYRKDDLTVIEIGEPRLLFEESQTTPSGDQIHLLTSKVPLRNAAGAITGVLGTYYDITLLKRAEAEQGKLQAALNQAQKLESVGRLAGGMAHDFNNKLQVIMGVTELLLMKTATPGELRACLEEIQTAARRSADLTRQLLAFSREQAITPVVLDLNEAVADSLKMIGRLIGENIRLEFARMNTWPIFIDAGQVDQILVNLAVNARDAISGGGAIIIEAENRTLDEADCRDKVDFVPPGDYVVLRFHDNGAGMPEDVRAHIFEPFFTTKEVGKGTGLGLAMVYGIVKQNNGAILVESEPGRGTTFSIHLPRSEKTAQGSASREIVDPRPTGTETILLVEDEESVLNLVSRELKQQGYTVLPSLTPRLAVEVCQHHPGPIHLLLTDVIMPEMNGKDLAKCIQELRPGIRVLFMSGYTAAIMNQLGGTSDSSRVLQKPFTGLELARRVREALNSAAAEDSKA